MKEIIIARDSDELNKLAAERFAAIARDSIENGGRFVVALAGGSTPKSLYRLLASENFRSQIDWRKVFFFFGDERNVLPDNEESNFRMAGENLLKPLDIGENQIFRWKTEFENAETIAADYEKTVKDFFNLKDNPPADADNFGKSEFPRFDLILLGMGEDGHTASLFPFTKALKENEKIAVANLVEKLETNRLTLTFPTINNAANIMFLISGEKKAEVLRAVLEGEFEPEKFPSQNLKPENGNLFWLLDEKAAQSLK